jgi:Tetratricopeptide repeat
MTQGTFSLGKMLVAGVAGLLLSVSTSQAAPPMGTGSGATGSHHHGGFPHMPNGNPQVPRFGYGAFYRPGYFYGYPGYYGYSGLDYAIAANREQQYQIALLYQSQQYNAALRQVQAAAQQQVRAAQQQTPTEPKPVTPAKVTAPKPTQIETQMSLSPEQRAAGKLKMANVLAQDGQTADAVDYFREIVQKYPNTLAAREAQDSLEKANQR